MKNEGIHAARYANARGIAHKQLRAGAVCIAGLLAVATCANAANIPRLGVVLDKTLPASAQTGMREGLREHGYIENQNILVDWRPFSGSIEQARPQVAALINARVDLILALTTSGARAAIEATKTIPIVFVSADPVATDLAESLAKPGANATGVSITSPELTAKRLDLLHQLLPRARRVAFLLNPSNASIAPQLSEAQRAADALGMRLETFEARNAAEIDASLRAIRRSAPDAILVAGDLGLLNERARIASAVHKARIPAVFPWKEYHDRGVLMSYGPNLQEVMRRAASYVAKILKGAKPGALPVEEISKFDLVIDLRVAQGLKIEVPATLLLRADEVIQ